jgi:3-oxoacyl-[acyl-carrier-protein] synthase-3
MTHFFGVAIAGTGRYLPERVLTNAELEHMVETSDEWIATRTGIRERRIAADGQPTSDLACRAAQAALADAGTAAEDLDLILVATLSPDAPFPNTACYVQKRLGVRDVPCLSMEAACSGFLYALCVGANMVRSGGFRTVLVVAAEKLSAYTDWSDRTTCVLFGDGAGAVVLKRVAPEEDGLLAFSLGADGSYTDLLRIPAGGTLMPTTRETVDGHLHTIQMQGREIFKLAVNAMVSSAETVLREAGLTVDDIRWLIPHQANKRIITAVGQRLGIPAERVYINVDRYGNTSAATIPIALDEVREGGTLQSGDHVLMVAFGGGLTWGAAVITI